MISYLLWLGRDGRETRRDWLLAATLDLVGLAWLGLLTAAAIKCLGL